MLRRRWCWGSAARWISIAALLCVLSVAGLQLPARAATQSATISLTTAQHIAAELKKKPVYIGPGAADALGSGALAKAKSKAAALHYPVYLIALKKVELGTTDDLLALVQGALNRKGLLIAVSPTDSMDFKIDGLKQYDTIYGQDRVLHDEEDVDTPPATRLNRFLTLLAHPKPVPSSTPTSNADHNSGDAGPRFSLGTIMGAIAIAALLVAALIVGIAMAATRRRKYRVPNRILESVRNSQRETLRKELSDDTLGISSRLTTMKLENLSEADAATVQHGLDAYDLAGRIVDSENSRSVDLAGAMVLLRTAERDLFSLDHRAKGRTGKNNCPLLFSAVNPLHGEATTTAELRTSGGTVVNIPTTKDDASDIKAGRTPQWLYDGDKPYPDRDTVWARTLFGSIGTDLVEAVTADHANRAERRRHT